jgi:hypothetical protein
MGLERDLPASDRQRMRDALAQLSMGAQAPSSLSQLLDEWRSIASTLAGGRSWSLANYNRGLRTRDALEEISEGLSMEGRMLLQRALAEIDREFIKATYDPLVPDSNSPPQNEVGWWQYRIPKDPGGILELGIPELGMSMEPPMEDAGGPSMLG